MAPKGRAPVHESPRLSALFDEEDPTDNATEEEESTEEDESTEEEEDEVVPSDEQKNFDNLEEGDKEESGSEMEPLAAPKKIKTCSGKRKVKAHDDHDAKKAKKSKSKSAHDAKKAKTSKSKSAHNAEKTKKSKSESAQKVMRATGQEKKSKSDAPQKAEEEKKSESESPQKAGEESTRSAFQRVWREEDEISLLQGMIHFKDKKKLDPSANIDAFHNYIKDFLGLGHVSVAQLKNKIRHLRTKYKSSVNKGEDMFYSKPHDKNTFDLSERVWGGAVGGRDTPMDSTKMAAQFVKGRGEQKLLLFLKGSLDEDFVSGEYELLEESKKAELLGKWDGIQYDEMEGRWFLLQDAMACLRDSYKSRNK